MASSHAAAAWSVDSLPEYASVLMGDESPEQEAVVDCLGDLQDLAPELGIIVTSQDINCAVLRRKMFAAVKCILSYSQDDLQSHVCPSQAQAILVVHVGLKIPQQVLEGISALSHNTSAPAILAILITEAEDEDESPALPQELAGARATFLESGADDVISIGSGWPLSGHHIIEAINRVEIQAQKMSELEMEATEIQEQATKEVNATKEMLQRKFQVAWKKMMWHLPGRCLESIPGEDSSLQERIDQDGGCVGVGDYTCVECLGQGLYGTVYKATDAEGAHVALKVIHKNGLKKVSHLLSLEQELCLMQHLPPHPNVTRARAAMHGPKNLYLVMEYTGSVNLHLFIQARIARTGAGALEADIASCFMPQMAKAVAHLHSLAICHRDLQPGKFIVSDNGERLSLANFGLAAMLCSSTQRLTKCCGSLPFIAPEVLQQQVEGSSYDPFAADIWSLAMNFVEIRKGPLFIERIIGWGLHHPTDPVQRIEGLRQFPSLFAGLSDADMMNGTVAKMLHLDPEERITIAEVMSRSGLGFETPTLPPLRSVSKVSMRGGLDLTTMAVTARTLHSEEQAFNKGTLLDRLGGEAVVRVAVHNMFDLATTNTPLSLLLDVCRGGMSAVRSLYADEVAEYFDSAASSTRAEGSLSRIRSAHKHLTVSDSDFDALSEHFAVALSGNDIHETILLQARKRFGELREPVTANYHRGAAHARSCGTPSWWAAVANDCSDRAQRFAEVLVGMLAQPSSLGAGAPRALQNADLVCAHFLRYLNGEKGVQSPVPLQGVALALSQVAIVVSNSRTALVQAGWQPEEVCILYFSLRRAWDRVRLGRKLRKLRSSSHPVDEAVWTTIVLSAHQAAQRCPGLSEISRHEDLIPFMATIGSILTEGAWEDHEERLDRFGHSLGIDNASFDMLVELFRSSSTKLVPKLESQVSTIVLALRPWVLARHQKSLMPEGPTGSTSWWACSGGAPGAVPERGPLL